VSTLRRMWNGWNDSRTSENVLHLALILDLECHLSPSRHTWCCRLSLPTQAPPEAPLLASADFQPVPSIIGVHNDEYGFVLPMVSLSPSFLGP
jgi:hypothetical protein